MWRPDCRPGEGVPWDTGEHFHSSPLETDRQLQLGRPESPGVGAGVGEALQKPVEQQAWTARVTWPL